MGPCLCGVAPNRKPIGCSLSVTQLCVLQLMRAVVMKQKSVLALWHWSQNLQRKVYRLFSLLYLL